MNVEQIKTTTDQLNPAVLTGAEAVVLVTNITSQIDQAIETANQIISQSGSLTESE